ncbi:hypothetical protein TNCV_1941671 [Trichonephila clavipes]|uniref:Uncharacterized protein n=1 Tax=Trichonephila clavipes TaxID=2585209 RepID=A0A8X6SHM5_TRICX|nr:hypothetical protein TNCV_1941671 [Trichonephila clavipes]
MMYKIKSLLEDRKDYKRFGDHAQASSTTLRIIMNDTSERMDISPSRLAQVAAREKLRDTVTGISALHMSLQEMDGRSHSPRSSFKEMYLSSTQAMIRKKEVWVTDVFCTPIGPPLLKSRPPLQTQVSNTTNIRVPDRGLKAAGTA